MRIGQAGVLAGLFLAVSMRVEAVTIRDDQADAYYLELGSRGAYDSVGLFVNDWGYTGCATLIAPDWILTAAHNLTAAVSGAFTVNGLSYASSRFVKHPDWTGDALKGYDLALVQLSSPVLDAPPAPLYVDSNEWGQTAQFVGLGFTGTGLTGWRSNDGRRRGFQNIIDGEFGNSDVVLGADFDNPHNPGDNHFGAALSLSLEGCVAPGDSGGGVFLSVGSSEYLAGVISFVAGTDGNGNADYGDVSGFARVSTFVPWIVTIIPEPSAGMLLLWGTAVVFARRLLPAGVIVQPQAQREH